MNNELMPAFCTTQFKRSLKKLIKDHKVDVIKKI